MNRLTARDLAELLAAAKAHRETLPLAQRIESDLNLAITRARLDLDDIPVAIRQIGTPA